MSLRSVVVIAGLVLLFARPACSQVLLPPHANRSVHDLARVLSAEHATAMEALHREVLDKTEVAIVVITVPRLDDEPIEEFALRVGAEWGVGRADQDRGIVAALALEERRIFVATGYGVEGFLPDGRVGGILDEHTTPLLARGEYSEALLRTSAALAAAAAVEYGVTLERRVPVAPLGGRTRGAPSAGGRVANVLLLVGLAYLFFRHPRLFFFLLLTGLGRPGYHGGSRGQFGGGGFGGGSGFGGFGDGGFGGGGAGRGW